MALCRTRAAVSRAIKGLPCKTRETVDLETPAACATSVMVTDARLALLWGWVMNSANKDSANIIDNILVGRHIISELDRSKFYIGTI
jgi:hypothetical protein